MSMSDEDRRQEAALAPFFEAARAAGPEPSTALLARVLEDAEAAQARHAGAQARPGLGPRPRAGLRARLAQGLGGWPALAGLAAAGVAGVWIGTALPATLPGLVPGTGDYLVDIAPDLALETGGGF
jgi:hypothetical protein